MATHSGPHNKVSKMKRQGKLNMRVISECVLMRLPKKLSKLVHAY